jgi:hypothetical protein
VSDGVMCLRCRRYIHSATQEVSIRDRCVCDVPEPSEDGVTRMQQERYPEPPRIRRVRK